MQADAESSSATVLEILTPHLALRDAIGHDVLGMRDALGQAGYAGRVVVQGVASEVATGVCLIDRPRDPPAARIYHHSMGWPAGEELLRSDDVPAAIRYHNITPPEFFRGVAPDFEYACKVGLASTARLAQRPARFWCASSFNAQDLARLGVSRQCTEVLPPFHQAEALAATVIDLPLLQALRQDQRPIILFVGGIKPNKGHRRAMAALARLRDQQGKQHRLIFTGGCDPRLARYQESLRQYARALLLSDDEVIFAGSVTQSQLRTYYMAADAFLCTSEHEGFCVPLVEAMLLRVPIIAWAQTAVGETIDDAGLVWDEDDPELLAESVGAVLESPGLRRTLVERGFRRYRERFAISRIEERFVLMVEDLLSCAQESRKVHA